MPDAIDELRSLGATDTEIHCVLASVTPAPSSEVAFWRTVFKITAMDNIRQRALFRAQREAAQEATDA